MAASKSPNKNVGTPASVTTALPSVDDITAQVLVLRGQKVLLAQQLAALYGVETRALNQAVQRNLARFPSDFMFQLNADEAELSRSQIVILNTASPLGHEALRSPDASLKRGANIKYLPYAFTEQGIAMLSSVYKKVSEPLR